MEKQIETDHLVDEQVQKTFSRRSQNVIYDGNPGVPRRQGRGTDDESPGVPRQQGQGTDEDSPRVPRRQGQGMGDDSPGAPRRQGQGLDRNNPGAPRRQGQGIDWNSSEAPRRQRQSNIADPGSRWLRNQGSDAIPGTSYQTQPLKQPSRHTRSSRRRPRHDSSSEESDQASYVFPSKRRHFSKTKSRGYDSAMLDKFLTILHNVRSSDKPRLSFNTNVIPDFDPMCKEQTALSWLTKVEECAEIYGWDDKETIHYALPKLTGIAKSWYQGLPTLMYTWTQWKKKIIESFPCRQDYAELLTEMLSKRVRYGESLEHYYYAKVNLLNRCKIYGKHAVDCILYGVEERALRLGAQAGQFNEPEQVLKYFRTVKIGFNRDRRDTFSRSRTERRTEISNVSKDNLPLGLICFNCNEMGHRSTKCSKPLMKCTTCCRLGHRTEHCFKNKPNIGKDKEERRNMINEKQVSELTLDNRNNKYIQDVKVNGMSVKCHVDLGSQCSLIKLSVVNELNIKLSTCDNLPILRGIGGNLIKPLGLTVCSLEVQGIEEMTEFLIVEDHVIRQPILLGHSFTEKPNITIVKTPSKLIFNKDNNDKFYLKSKTRITIPAGRIQYFTVTSDSHDSGYVIINGSLRGSEGNSYYLFPGEFDIKDGVSVLIALNPSCCDIGIDKGKLITRPEFRLSDNQDISNICCVNFDDETVISGEKLTSLERTQLQSLLSTYTSCFSTGLRDLGFTSVTEMIIELEDTEPVVYRPYRMSIAERSLVRNMVQEMLDSGIVRDSSSPYASPIVLVQKKSGEKRLCVDYRALNRKTKKSHYPLPRIEDQLDQLSGNSLFTSLDLASGYYQIPISEESRHRTAFVTPDGQFEYNRMPFGLVNAPSVFQKTINKILLEAKIKYAIVYMDDILIPSIDVNQGLKRLEEVLILLKNGGLTLKLGKCRFFQSKLDFLGFEVSANGIRPGLRKIEAVAKFRTPSNQHELRQFLGLSGFFRRFIKDYALVASPLTNLLRKDAKWNWENPQAQAFEKLKNSLTERPLLALYNPEAETQLHTDASKEGVAGILLQPDSDGVLHPVSYFSRKTTPDESKMHSYELETLAVVSSLNRFRVYLIGISFRIFTDCNALRFTLTKRDVIPRIARWWVQLQEYDCTVEYRPGTRMAHVDALSRNPIHTSEVETHFLDVFALENSDQDWISTVQCADDEVRRIKEIINEPTLHPGSDYCTNYKCKNGRVYRVVGGDLKWLVPKGVRWQIVKRNHDDVGHCGFDKTLQRVQKHYWFAKMRRFIKKYVSSCLECAHHKVPGGKREGELHPIEKTNIPFHTIHVDHLGPFIKSKRGYCYLLVIIDGFSKYINITPVRNTKSMTTIKSIKEHISYFGVPTLLITDKGSTFTSKAFKDFILSYGIKHIENAVSTPRANGQVERFNRTILDALSTTTHDNDERNWDECIHDIQVGLNTSTHKTTQKSPSELVFGFNIISRSQGILSDIINNTTTRDTPEMVIHNRNSVSERIKVQQLKDSERFNKSRKSATVYKEGDLVRVERQVPHDGKSQKLVNKFQGPYRIVKVLPNDRYLIEDTPVTRKKGRQYRNVVAVDKIHPWLVYNRDLGINEEDCSTDSNQ